MDETYSADSVALIQISGTSTHNNKAVQVDAVCQSIFLWFLKYSVCRQMFCLNVLASFFNIALHVSDLETIIFAYCFGSSGQCFDC